MDGKMKKIRTIIECIKCKCRYHYEWFKPDKDICYYCRKDVKNGT
jgi:hypothetical protein